MKGIFSKIGWCALLGIFVVPFSILSHELGHYLAYIFFGVENVIFRSASVAADKSALTNGEIAFATALGPVITYVTIVVAAVVLRYRYVSFLLMLGLAAPLGRIVNFVYVYLRIAGYQPNPNFDEFNFATALQFDPLFVAVPTLIAVVGTLGYFGFVAWKNGGWREIASAIAGVAVGLAVWFQIGPLILP